MWKVRLLNSYDLSKLEKKSPPCFFSETVQSWICLFFILRRIEYENETYWFVQNNLFNL